MATNPIPLKEVIQFSGAKEIMLAFFCYCALEQTVGLWASSYLVVYKEISEVTASAYIGTSIMPPLFGLLSNYIGIFMLPVYLLPILAIQFVMYNRVLKISSGAIN